MKPLRVAIDTSIFENVHYSFDGHDLSILKKHVDDGKISGLLVSDIVIEEAKSHFYKNADVICKKVSALIGSREYKLLESTDSIKKLKLKPTDVQKMADEQFALFNKYLKSVNTAKLSSNSVRIKGILFDYFHTNPPFGSGEKNRNFQMR